MNFAGLLYLLIVHYLCGSGVLRLFKLQLNPVPAFCFSLMLGVPLLSFVPCILQLLHIPITRQSVFIAIDVFTAIFGLPLLINFKCPRFPEIVFPKFYEWPILIVCLFLLLVSVWRCFYLPPYSRDMLSGPELLAEYAVREKTMISSVFTVDLSTSNNYFKSPFITCLQIIYKLVVFPFGQLWLSILSVSFTLWLFTVLRDRLHPVLAGLLLLLFLIIPELYAYTYMVLYDYSNMVFFFCGYYFLTRYVESNRFNDFAFSIFLFGLATYIRTETLVLITIIMPLLVFYYYRKRLPFQKAIYNLGIFFIIPAAFWFLNIHIFIRQFIPIHFDVSQSLNPNLGNISVFFQRLQEISTRLIFSQTGILDYGWYFFLFCAILLMDIIWQRRFNRESLIALYGIAVVYFGLGFIGYLLPLADLENTTKRGLFKALPLMLIYLSNSGFLLRFSDLICKWEKLKQ